MANKIRIIQPATRQAQPERTQLPPGVEYCLFLVKTAPDGYPDGQWVALTLPDMQLLVLPVTGFQHVWRLVSMLTSAKPSTVDDLKEILAKPHKVMSADRMNWQ